MGSGQSSPEPEPPSPPSTSVCDFAQEQNLKLVEAIKKIGIDASIKIILKNKSYDHIIWDAIATIPEVDGAAFASYMATLTGKAFKDINEHYTLLRPYGSRFSLILERLLYAQVTRLFEEYKTILESITALCEKYKSTYIPDVDETIKHDTDVLFNKIREEENHFKLFEINNQKAPVVIQKKLEETIDIINKINERFSNIDELISEMKTIYVKQKNREASSLFGRNGGSSRSRSSSKKRKQMKIKMKSSNYRSKTRNNKQKYKKCKSVKK
jgi:hypothetical protein